MVRGRFTPVLVMVLALGIPVAAQAADPACKGWIGIDSGAQRGAEIYLDGKKRAEVTPDTLKGIPCGKHTVELRLPMFRSERREVVVQAADVAKVAVELVSNAGSLELSSEPAEAEVLIDGKVVGKTPLKLAQVEAGQRRLEVRLADHAPVQRKLVIKAGQNAVLKVALKPQFGGLAVTVKHDGEFIVWLDGDPLGPAPLDLKRVPPGPHQVKVTSELYSPWESKVRVLAGKTARLRATPRPAFGTLIIRSKPAGARIRVDEQELGQAPVTVRLKPGAHAILATGEGPGLGRAEAKVELKKGARRKLVVKLPVRVGALMIDSVPFAARIEIDGKRRGKAPLSLKNIPVGVHVLRAQAPKLPPLYGRILVVEGKRSVAEMNLKEPNKSKYVSPPAPAVVAAAPAPKKAAPAPKPAAKKKDAAAEAKPVAKDETKPAAAKEEERDQAPDPDLEKVLAKNEATTARSADTEVSARAAAPMSFQRMAAWGTAGLAVAAAVTGAVMTGLGFAKDADADKAWERYLADPTDQNKNKYENLDQKTADYKNSAWGLFGGAAVIGAVSVVLFLTEPEPEVDISGPRDGILFTPLRGGGGYVGYQFRF